jgi:uncharacterized lipoprotein YajG
MNKLANWQLHLAFDGWRAGVENQARLTVVVNRIASRLQQNSVSKAWESWIGHHELIMRAEHIMNKLANWQLHLAFDGWRAGIENQARLAVIVDRILRRLQQHNLDKAWESWAGYHKQFLKTKRVLVLVTARIKNGKVARAFYSWQGAAAKLKHMANFVGRVFKRLANRQCSAALGCWAEVVRQLKALKRISKRLLNSQLNRAVRSWVSLVAMQKEEQYEEDAKQRRLANILRRVLRSCEGRAFNLWQLATEEVVRLADLVERVVARIQVRKTPSWPRSWANFSLF